MKNHNRIKDLAVMLFSVTVAVYIVFFLYMAASEGAAVHQPEQPHGYEIVTGIQRELISDDTATVGVRKVFQWVLDSEIPKESCLLFYTAHHEAAVFFDDVPAFTFTTADKYIGRNVSSRWYFVDTGTEHAGQTVTVVLTPLFETAIERDPEFLFGSASSVILDILSSELPLLVLSAASILLGLFTIAVSVYFRYILKTGNSGLVYLSLFSVALGLWQTTGLKSSILLMPEHSAAIEYIRAGALLLCNLCLGMYFSTLFVKQRNGLILLLSCGSALMCLYVLAMQVFGITDFRQNLFFSHLLLVITIAALPLAAAVNRIVFKSWGLLRSWRLLSLLYVGFGLDLILYCDNQSNGLLHFSIVSFIIYTLIVFLRSVQESTRKAYIDSRTGLENRTRWNELMHDEAPLPEPFAILVIDLNGLKQVNDTLGHDSGDQMIYGLSNILRSTLPRSSVVCRWGGDEFTAILTGINRTQLDAQIRKLFSAAKRYNEENPELPVYFALGTALSEEHPGISRTELFRLADEEMYRSKQLWYRQKQTDSD